MIVGLAAAGTMLLGGDTSQTGRPQKPRHHESRRPLAAAPLELIALGHERDADGLTVRGVLRNPSSGSEISHLTAVVLLFDR